MCFQRSDRANPSVQIVARKYYNPMQTLDIDAPLENSIGIRLYEICRRIERNYISFNLRGKQLSDLKIL